VRNFKHKGALFCKQDTKEKIERDRETKKERGFPEFIVLHPQIKLDSVLSQVYMTSIKVSIAFQMQVEM
jgi:hypothetical protein